MFAHVFHSRVENALSFGQLVVTGENVLKIGESSSDLLVVAGGKPHLERAPQIRYAVLALPCLHAAHGVVGRREQRPVVELLGDLL